MYKLDMSRVLHITINYSAFLMNSNEKSDIISDLKDYKTNVSNKNCSKHLNLCGFKN